jgi:hypothetical protein
MAAAAAAPSAGTGLVQLVLVSAIDGSQIGSKLVGRSTSDEAVQQWARETCGWSGQAGCVRFRLQGNEADFGLELLWDMADTVVHVEAHMFKPPAAPSEPDRQYKKGRSMAYRSKARAPAGPARAGCGGALLLTVPCTACAQGNKVSTLNENTAKLVRKGQDSKMARAVVASLARRDADLGARPAHDAFRTALGHRRLGAT